VGTTIEWYDFFLYGTAAALIFPKLFFPGSSEFAGILLSFSTQFVGFAARPIGAAIFGHYGDRVGRKATLITTLMLMGIATFLIGLLPGYDTLGVAAPIILTLLRVAQGIGVGGEWGGSVLMAMEWGENRRRGLMASWPQLGVPMGLLLSTALVRIMSGILPADAFNSWGWRVPFLLSIVLVAIGLYVRLRVMESPQFAEVKRSDQVHRQPFIQVLKEHPMEILTSVGRRLMYGIGIVCMGLYAFPYFGLLNTKVAGLALLAIVLSLIFHDMMYGPQAALIAESFGTNLRYSGAGLGYQLASVIAGGPAPLIAAAILDATKSSTWISWYIVGCCVLSMIALVLMPRTQLRREAAGEDVGVARGTTGTT
jgi:MFS family permease